jgi:hypothetical protein
MRMRIYEVALWLCGVSEILFVGFQSRRMVGVETAFGIVDSPDVVASR